MSSIPYGIWASTVLQLQPVKKIPMYPIQLPVSSGRILSPLNLTTTVSMFRYAVSDMRFRFEF